MEQKLLRVAADLEAQLDRRRATLNALSAMQRRLAERDEVMSQRHVRQLAEQDAALRRDVAAATMNQCRGEKLELENVVAHLRNQIESLSAIVRAQPPLTGQCGLTKQELAHLEARGQATLNRYQRLVEQGNVTPAKLKQVATSLAMINSDLHRQLETVKAGIGTDVNKLHEYRQGLLNANRGRHAAIHSGKQ